MYWFCPSNRILLVSIKKESVVCVFPIILSTCYFTPTALFYSLLSDNLKTSGFSTVRLLWENLLSWQMKLQFRTKEWSVDLSKFLIDDCTLHQNYEKQYSIDKQHRFTMILLMNEWYRGKENFEDKIMEPFAEYNQKL